LHLIAAKEREQIVLSAEGAQSQKIAADNYLIDTYLIDFRGFGRFRL